MVRVEAKKEIPNETHEKGLQVDLEFHLGAMDYAKHKDSNKKDIVGGRSLKERKAPVKQRLAIMSRKCILFILLYAK